MNPDTPSPSDAARRVRIAELNDRFRTAEGGSGRVHWTRGITRRSLRDQAAILHKVETFSAFTPENDPHGEHDFGAFEHNGHRIVWTIHYYTPDLEHSSPDPADPTQTLRVLTVMLAEEY